MSIPDGTKFHGVSPSVDTSNRGSASLNSKRDAYTIDDICDSCSEGIIKIEPVLFVTASPPERIHILFLVLQLYLTERFVL